ncbi:MAG: hypothetical protein RLZZ528_2167 [Pseudomonadota bacterium]|jgi:uncharacterized membrane protein YbaN (DUF454 family)
MKTGLRYVWLAVGCLALAAGIVGLFLPILPTVPFVLLAAFGFARSSERLHRWLLAHPVLGPPILDWQERGAVSRRAKWLASLSMAGSLVIAVVLNLPPPLVALQGAVMAAVAGFLWTRPDR